MFITFYISVLKYTKQIYKFEYQLMQVMQISHLNYK